MSAPAATPGPRDRPGPGVQGAALPRALVIVPARLGSTRLERKMLLAETGLPLFAHTARRAASCAAVAAVVVATDAEEIAALARAHGLRALLTRADHRTGTDRALEAFEQLAAEGDAAEVVLNVQGDEPEIEPADLARLVAAFEDPAVELATLATEGLGARELASPDVVKVVCDARGDALYFSRAPIPSSLRARGPARAAAGRRHVGAYAFRPAALRAFCALPEGALEAGENLEQLRWLEAGRRMRVVPASSAPPGIDTRADYQAFVERTRAAHSAATPDPVQRGSSRVR